MEDKNQINVNIQHQILHQQDLFNTSSSCSIQEVCGQGKLQKNMHILNVQNTNQNFQQIEKNFEFQDQNFMNSACSIHEICNQLLYSTGIQKRITTKTKLTPNIDNQFFQINPCNMSFFTQTKLKSNDNKKIGTDRFIPSRKDSLGSLLLIKEKGDKQNNQNILKKQETSNQIIKISDVYKKHVLGMSTQSISEKPMNTFKNKNQFKYSQQKIQQIIYSSKSILNLRQQLSFTLPKANRKINRTPVKVLDAPSLQDDFYLNLLDWSDQNILGVGLYSSVYLWNSYSSKVNKLCQLGTNDLITAISWSPKSNILAVGTNSSQVQLWDVVKNAKIRTFIGHIARVGCVSWNSSDFFSSGSRDKTILNRDIRQNNQYINKLTGHKQQVCGLKWSYDHQQLASGGNDNKLCVWNNYSNSPLFNFSQHQAAVKALTWSPHQHGLLVSGGGTADRSIRFWNTLSGNQINCVDTGSQVCNLMFAKSVNQLVSTHGYSLNEINIWKYPSMQKVSTLTGHTFRVLYLAMNPQGNTIVTGAGDETLRFWSVFPSLQIKNNDQKSELIGESSWIR